MKKLVLLSFLVSIMGFTAFAQKSETVGKTEITKWQYDKKSAVSLTYDDGTINQFRVARPIMNKLGFPGTFYVISGTVPGSQYSPKFIGRPVDEIITETANIPTNEDNFFERASAVRFLGYKDTYAYHNQAGSQFEQGNIQEAYKLIDEAYKKVRNGAFETSDDSVEARKALYDVLFVDPPVDLVTWDQLRKYQTNGHEIGSHTVSHPYLAVMDSANLMYELEKSKEDILNQLGREATFTAECPFGTEDERVMQHAHKVYPALRNRMPAPYLAELNRSSDENPTEAQKEYVQWQRGALSDTPMKQMKSWVDTALSEDNIWLVLVFHGIEGIGWEPLTEDELQEYFSYIKEKEPDLWVATFKDVTKYVRERKNAEIDVQNNETSLAVNLSHSLKDDRYNLPLTLKTYVPNQWKTISIQQNEEQQTVQSREDEQGRFVLYQAMPNSGPVNLTRD